MPTLLRIVLGAIVLALINAGAALLAVQTVETSSSLDVVQVLGLSLLAIPMLVAGSLASSWSWHDGPGRRWAGRLFGVLAALTLAGGAAVLLPAVTADRGVVATGVLVLVAFALFPVCIAIGRAARRAETRSGFPGEMPPAADDAEVDALLASGRRRGWVGAAIGLGLGALALIGVLLLVVLVAHGRHGGAEVVEGGALAVGFALIGAAIGRLTVTFDLTRRVREVLGADLGTARAIGRAVRGRSVELTPEQSARAARYAPLALRTTPFQFRSSLYTLGGVAAMQAGSIALSGIDPVRASTFAIVVIAVVIAVPMRVVGRRRMLAYAAAHPVPVGA